MTRDAALVAGAAAAWSAALLALLAPHVAVTAAAALVVVPLAVVAATLRRRDPLVSSLCLVAVVSALGAGAAASARRVSIEHSSLRPLAARGESVRVQGVVASDPVALRDGTGGVPSVARGVVLRVRVESVVAAGAVLPTRVPVLVIGPASWGSVLPGQHVGALVRLGPARGRDVAATAVTRSPPVLVGRPPVLQRMAGRLRDGLRASVRGAPADARGLVPALVVGDTRDLPESLVDDLRRAGLTHVTAVSGANVAIVLAAVLLTARLAGARGRLLAVLGLVTVAGFVVLARPQPSVLRAAVMGGVAVLASTRGGSRRRVGALASAVLVLLAVDPWLAVSLGFALSCAATAGLVAFVPAITARLPRTWPRPVAEAAAVTVAAQVAVAPLIAALTGRVEPGALAANLLAVPAVAPATVLGVVAALVEPWWSWGGSVVGWCACWPARWISWVAHRAASSSLAVLPWPHGVAGGLLLLVLLLVAVIGWRWRRAPRPGGRR